MSEHSEEPWHEMMGYADNGGMYCGISDKRGNEVCGEYSMGEADRLRTIRCVNACAGIPNEYLGGGIDMPYKRDVEELRTKVDNWVIRCDKAEKQRDQLREALKIAKGCIQHYQHVGSNYKKQADAAMAVIEAALAAAGGE